MIEYISTWSYVESKYNGAAIDPAQVNGQFFTQNLMLLPYVDQPSYIEYDLARGYRVFRSSLGLRDDSLSSSLVRVQVFVDGAEVYTKDLVLGQLETIELDITGALRIRMQVSDLAGQGGQRWAVFGDAKVLGIPSEVPTPPAA